MELTIIGNTAKYNQPTAVKTSPFVIDLIGLRQGVEWHYRTNNRANIVKDNRIELDVEVGVLNLSLIGYIRGKKAVEVFAEPLVITEEADIYHAEPLFEVIAKRLADLDTKVARLESIVQELKATTKADGDRITIIENEYDILRT